jgi:hypothetical protein
MPLEGEQIETHWPGGLNLLSPTAVATYFRAGDFSFLRTLLSSGSSLVCEK